MTRGRHGPRSPRAGASGWLLLAGAATALLSWCGSSGAWAAAASGETTTGVLADAGPQPPPAPSLPAASASGAPSPSPSPSQMLPSPAAATNAAPSRPPGSAPATTASHTVTDPAGALERARAAYEYGDIDEMVESARQVADGRLHPSPAQRAVALRYLGIGLFLTGRAEGAETAFFELLRLRPESRLDPQTTRPDAVAFFEHVRLQYAKPISDAARANNRKVLAWNFVPPAGQVQNGHTTRAITIGGIELVSLTVAITTFSLLKNWQGPHQTFPGHEDAAPRVRDLNWISVGVLGAAFIYGVIDGIAHYAEPADEDRVAGATTARRPSLTPGGFSFDF